MSDKTEKSKPSKKFVGFIQANGKPYLKKEAFIKKLMPLNLKQNHFMEKSFLVS